MAKRILIVDDDVAIASLLAQALNDEGYNTHTTTQSLRFYDAVHEYHPDLILLDLMMPYLDGQDELKLMSMQPDTSAIPVIMITASSEAKHNEAKYREMGVKAVILKPFDLSSLLEMVKQTLAQPQLA